MTDTHDDSRLLEGAIAGVDTRAWPGLFAVERPAADSRLLRRAVEVAARAHAGQFRASGEPYVVHVLTVAEILSGLGLDVETLAAAVLHDVVEDTAITLSELELEFGSTVARLVDGVTKMARISRRREEGQAVAGHDDQHAESLRKLLLATVEDVRVILVKLADRLHNMRTLEFLDAERQYRIARETLDIYAPLANRLGIWQFKWELEDLAFRYLNPEAYRDIATKLDEKRSDRERDIQCVVDRLQRELAAAGIQAEVTGRPKHIYSIWRKMQRKNVDFHQIFDVRAVRVLVQEVADCYAALGVVHSLWHHIPKEFDDYIANPKGNNYRSLHTAVVGPRGRTLEIQIRTREMHEQAELGVAAHWRYKEGARFDPAFERRIAWLRQVLDWKEEDSGAGDFIDRFKLEAGKERIYVLTPQGQVLDLPQGATPLDFAYYIHTDVGHRCRGARVNGRMVPLTYELHSGEQVEILTTRQGRPSRDWLIPHLGYLRTARARAKVRQWFKVQDEGKNMAAGRALLERELARLGYGDIDPDVLVKRFRHKDLGSLQAAIGRGDISPAQIAAAASELVGDHPRENELHPVRHSRARTGGGIQIRGVGNLLTHMAQCCKPVPPDPVIGYITRGRGVTIHRQDCPNMLRLQSDDRDRLIEVEWGAREDDLYPVDIEIHAYDRPGLLRDIAAVLASERANVTATDTHTDKKTSLARMRLTVEIRNMAQLSLLLNRINQLPNVLEVRRTQRN